jgi:hypothetical protein
LDACQLYVECLRLANVPNRRIFEDRLLEAPALQPGAPIGAKEP